MKFRSGLCKNESECGWGWGTAFQPQDQDMLNLRVREKSECLAFSGNPKKLRVEHKQQVVCVCGREECTEGTKADRAQVRGELCRPARA